MASTLASTHGWLSLITLCVGAASSCHQPRTPYPLLSATSTTPRSTPAKLTRMSTHIQQTATPFLRPTRSASTIPLLVKTYRVHWPSHLYLRRTTPSSSRTNTSQGSTLSKTPTSEPTKISYTSSATSISRPPSVPYSSINSPTCRRPASRHPRRDSTPYKFKKALHTRCNLISTTSLSPILPRCFPSQLSTFP